jgi:DNA-binding NarL/FixJ family response regulator
VTPAITVLVAEPDEPLRMGIRLALEDAGLPVCCEPLDARSAAAAALLHRPAVALIAERLPGGALVAVDAIYRALPAAKLLVLTESDAPRGLMAAIRAGASGYLRKDIDPARLPATIRGVLDGEAALSRRLTSVLIESVRHRERGRFSPTTPGGPSITDRQLEVLELMTEGLRTSEIADRLTISEVTVRRHISSVISKLGVTDRTAAIEILTGRSRI